MGFSHKKVNYSCPKHEQSLEEISYDWLSNLPNDILLHILSFLNVNEVVRTCVLSRKWRFIWSSIPCLNFDFRDYWNQDHCLALSYDECQSKFWLFVKWIIIIRDRDASPIYKLRFLSDYFDAYLLELLISLCVKRGIPELDLLAGYGIRQCPLYYGVTENVYLITQNLSKLVELEYCTGFGNLKTLHLVRVRFHDPDITDKLFSDCGILENLSLEYCCFLMIKFLNISANKLRKLHFVNTGQNCCKCMRRFEGFLKLQTPNLVSFCYIGPAIQFCEFSDMLFLKHALIQVDREEYQLILCQKLDAIVSSINHVEELSLSSLFAKIAKDIENLMCTWQNTYFFVACNLSGYFAIGGSGFYSSPFHNLRRLKLDVEGNVEHIDGLINLLQMSPSLEFLHIKLFKTWMTNNWKSKVADVPCLSCNLKEVEVEIVAFHGMLESLELIKFFLQNGKALERIKIVQKKKKVNPETFYAFHEVDLASEAVSLSVASISASGIMELLHLVYEKCGVSIQTQTGKVKTRIRRSMRISAKKSGGSS